MSITKTGNKLMTYGIPAIMGAMDYSMNPERTVGGEIVGTGLGMGLSKGINEVGERLLRRDLIKNNTGLFGKIEKVIPISNMAKKFPGLAKWRTPLLIGADIAANMALMDPMMRLGEKLSHPFKKAKRALENEV